MIIVIDNYDSFTYNLVHYIGEFEQDIKVIRNDEMSVTEIMDNNPSKIVISPGPCTPKEAGISVELIKTAEVPILGVCLDIKQLVQLLVEILLRHQKFFMEKLQASIMMEACFLVKLKNLMMLSDTIV